MSRQPIRLGILALALSASAGAVPQPTAPSPADASSPTRATSQSNPPAQSNTSSQAQKTPTPAQLDQPGAVAMPPPILRNTGRTYVGSEQPLLGQLPQGQRSPGALGEQPPPALQPASNEAAIRSGMGEVPAVH